MKFSRLSSNLLYSDSKPLCSTFLFECTKSFLMNGYHVHYISKSKVDEIPFTVHGGVKPNVDAYGRLSLKNYKNAELLFEYASELQYIESRCSKLPKVVVLQDLEVYVQDLRRGILTIALLIDALNAIGKSFNSPVYLLAGLSITSPLRILPSLINNFFSTSWKISVDDERGNIVKMCNYLNQNEEIKFGIGNEKIFLDRISKLTSTEDVKFLNINTKT